MAATSERMPPRPGRAPDLDDTFEAGADPRWWVPAYLPHWTTADRAAARTRVVTGGLELRIDSDQPDWRPEDAPLRVTNLQTGTYSGPLGSPRGTHRHRQDGLMVRTETPLRLLFAPSRGRIEITLSASRDPGCMVAAWLVGTEHHSPEDSGEICIVEIDAETIGAATVARSGVKAHHDPRLVSDLAEVVIPVDASRPHTWTVVWGAGETVVGCEDVVVRRLDQAPDYPMLMMIDLFEIGSPAGVYPKTAVIHRVRGWSE